MTGVPRCFRCDYDLTGIPPVRCPECGCLEPIRDVVQLPERALNFVTIGLIALTMWAVSASIVMEFDGGCETWYWNLWEINIHGWRKLHAPYLTLYRFAVFVPLGFSLLLPILRRRRWREFVLEMAAVGVLSLPCIAIGLSFYDRKVGFEWPAVAVWPMALGLLLILRFIYPLSYCVQSFWSQIHARTTHTPSSPPSAPSGRS